MKLLVLFCIAFSAVNADVYIQQFRGSNDRLDEANRNRNNDNRLFDSQNNNRGGYNVGRLTVYSGEKVPISWTNQHGSGTYQLKGSEIIIQYMCDELARDGTTTGTIPTNNYDCLNYDCDTDVEYGRHESYWYWHQCRSHERNFGLFTANQNMNNRNSATRTRQNPAGTRYGYECPEERDYYPYWRPSPWRDVVIYTNQVERCSAYKKESQNVKSKWECRYTDDYWTEVLKESSNGMEAKLPSNHTKCAMGEELVYKNKTYNKYYLHKESSHGITAPDCMASVTTRANHLGTFGGRELWTHIWTVPHLNNDNKYKKADYSQCCVVRVRYNITTDDYEAWESDSSINAGLDYKNNTKVGPNPDPNDDPAWVKIWEKFRLSYEDVYQSFNGDADSDAQYRSRGYVFRNNPHVDPFGYKWNATDQAYRLLLELAINTNQFGRTFQDRTHCFTIKDETKTDGTVKLLSVQGKRGNIVQVYPATEYFFVPEPMVVGKNDYVHFCWTGSNTNPNNNDGQGKQGTDRSNICPLSEPQYDKSEYNDIDGNVDYAKAGAVGDLGNNYPNFVDEPSYSDVLPDLDMLKYPHYRSFLGAESRMAGLDQNILNDLCTQRRVDDEDDLFDYGNMEEFDDAGTTYCITPQKVQENGRWNFLCTRNNNFSNRSQKGTITVGDMASFATFSVGTTGGSYSSGAGGAIININDGMVAEGSTLNIELTTWTEPGADSSIVQISGSSGAAFDESALVDDGWFELWIPYTPATLSGPEAFRRADASKKWKSQGEASINEKRGTSYAVINVSKGGFYKVNNVAHIGYIIAMVVLGSALIAIAGWTLVKKCKS